jgi:hypothetical protein
MLIAHLHKFMFMCSLASYAKFDNGRSLKEKPIEDMEGEFTIEEELVSS